MTQNSTVCCTPKTKHGRLCRQQVLSTRDNRGCMWNWGHFRNACCMKLQANRLFQMTVMQRVQRQLQLLVLVAVVVGRSHTKLRTVPQT